MSRIPKKYIESHWLIFACQGIIGLVMGLFVVLTDITNVSTLITMVAVTIALFGLTEIINIIMRQKRGHGWNATLFMALLDLGVAISIGFLRDEDYTTHIIILAAYTIIRGVFALFIGLRALTNPTDKFIWTVSGTLSAILGFVILADQGKSDVMFIQIFGIYLMILGLTTLIYSVHSKNQLLDAPASDKK